jgi:GAF domain-containing protein
LAPGFYTADLDAEGDAEVAAVPSSEATLGASDIEAIAAALAAADPRQATLRVVERIAAQRIGVTLFSASLCHVEAMEVERIYSSLPERYPLGARTNKRETSWGRQVLLERRVFVGEGALEMAAAFDDKEGMASVGVRSIINVPIVLRGQCLGVLNFGRGIERVSPAEVTVARFLGVASSAVFTTGLSA